MELKQTSMGELPEEWEVVGLGEVCDQRKETLLPSGKGDYKFVGLEHITPGETKLKKFVPDTNVKSLKFKFYSGDILYGKLRPYLDKAVITDLEGISSTDLLVLTPNSKKTLAEFLIYLIHSKGFIQKAMATTSGTNHPRTSWKGISKFKFGLPPLPEQQRVVGVLSTVDDAIQKVDDAITKTERLKKGLMQRLLTRGIGHERFKDTKIGRIPEEWEVTAIGEACKVVTGGTPSTKHPEYFGGNIKWLKSGDIKGLYIFDTKEKITELGVENSNATIHPADSVAIALSGRGLTRGRTAIVKEPMTCSQSVAIMIPNSDLLAEFLHYNLSNRYLEIRNLTGHNDRSGLNLSIVGKIKIPIALLSEQQKIAEILTTVDRKLELEHQRKAKLERIKKGLMNDLLTGRKRMKVGV